MPHLTRLRLLTLFCLLAMLSFSAAAYAQFALFQSPKEPAAEKVKTAESPATKAVEAATEKKQTKAPVFTVLTGSKTGTYYQFGQDLRKLTTGKQKIAEATIPTFEVLESHGSIDNITRISSPESSRTSTRTNVGIVQSDVLGFLARSEQPQFQSVAKNLRLVFPFYQEEVHVLSGTHIFRFEELNGKQVVVGEEGSGSWLTAMNLFHHYDVRPSKLLRLSPEEGAIAVLRGRADAMVFVSGKPVKLFRNMENLAKAANVQDKDLLEKIHFLPLTSAALKYEYAPATITSKDYSFVETDVSTIAVSALLVTLEPEEKSPSCAQLTSFVARVRDAFPDMKQSGHPKWKEVDLNADIGTWKRSECAAKNSSSAAMEAELLKSVNPTW